MGTAEVVDAEVVEETGTALVPAAPASATLFRTDDPVEVIERATRAADALKRVITERGMVQRIGNREHVKVEGWQTLGGMVGVVAGPPRIRELPWPENDRLPDHLRKIRDQGYAFGYEAKFEALTLDGRVVGGGESACKRTESAWCMRRGDIVDDFALESMAQTRATSRTLQGPLRFIVTLAGYSGTPAEEMPQQAAPAAQQPPPNNRTTAPNTTAQPVQQSERPITANQKGAINGRCAKAGLSVDQVKAILNWVGGSAILDRLSSKTASKLIDSLEKDGSGAGQILEDIRLAAEGGDDRAQKIIGRFLEASNA